MNGSAEAPVRCDNCGELRADTAFCASCGAPKGAVVTTLDPVEPDVVTRPGPSRRAGLTAAAGLAVLVAVAGWLALAGGSDSAESAAAATTTVLEPDAALASDSIPADPSPAAIETLDQDLGVHVLSLSRGALRRTDLDSGESEQINLATTRGRSLLRIGDQVVLANLDLGELTEVIAEPMELGRVVLTSRFADISTAGGNVLVISDLDRTSFVPAWSIMRSFDAPPEPVELPATFRATSIAGVDGDAVVVNSRVGAVVWEHPLVREELRGHVLAAVDGRGVWLDCDDGLDCGLRTGALGTRGDLVVGSDGGLNPFGTFELQVAGTTVVSLGQGVVGDDFDVLVIDLETGMHDQFELPRTGGVAPGAWAILPDGSGIVGTESVLLFDCGCLRRHGADLLPVVGLDGAGLVVVEKESASEP